jgi:hypothetical protein
MSSSIREAVYALCVAASVMLTIVGCGGSEGDSDPPREHAARVALDEPDVTFPVAFSSVAGLRELSDGRVMVSDRLGQALMIVNMDAGTADTIGRMGGGPGEYSSPSRLYPWRGDSTIVLDLGNTRFTPVGTKGGFGISTPLMSQDGESMRLIMPEGTDRHGSVYYQARSFGARPGAPGDDAPDSALIVRWNPATGRTDTVAAVGLPERKIQRSGGNVAMMSIPFSASDDWAVSWDGDVGVARGSGFRVEWREMDGGTKAGPDVPYDALEITQEDKDAWLEARANPSGGGMFITVQTGGGGGSDVRAAPPPRGARMVGPQIADEDWPDVKPPFPPSAVSVTPNGHLWVERHVAHGQSSEYDVFDSDGERVRTVMLPEASRVAGFGDGVVYVARTDEYDLQWLERYTRR